MSVYVVIIGKLLDGVEARLFELVIGQVSRAIAEYTGNVINDELIRDSEDPSAYMLVSKWTSKEAWDSWRSTTMHVEQVSPLRPYWQMQSVRAYETVFTDERSPLLS
ncbi:hypothetical protein EPA93_13130 [Ktedonosporobacter rubrisoli]|uniref:ABM domain-containing protein n=1 Tax=Ktedonosporobacter rubrisoli TaxID=2509675 RepID=A0A4P6JNS0_KTERU|nr:antibiotic biosynthesis monooxygenase family protein [Ktedonosporobacter rubrisoli]QBD76895.1 hypothetical protein EPA93_13130 [Ktedonosporobacter rubrisoli]